MCTEDLKTKVDISNVSLESEPNFLGLGPQHLATGFNNFAYIYRYISQDGNYCNPPTLESKQDYLSSIKEVKLNAGYAAILTEKNVFLQSLNKSDEENLRFPESDDDSRIRWIHLTDNFLIMLNKENKISVYNIEEQVTSTSFKSSIDIVKMFANSNGTKAVCIDKQGSGHLLNFLNEKVLRIDGFTDRIISVLWDMYNPNLFVGVEINRALSFIYNRNHFKGEECSVVKEILSMDDVDSTEDIAATKINKGNNPIIIADGYILMLSETDDLVGYWLGSHSSYSTFTSDPDDEDNNLRYFFQNLSINKLNDCLAYCHMIGEEDKDSGYEVLAERSLKNLNLPIAKKAYQLAGNISMVHSLNHLEYIEEKKVLQGLVAMIFCDYNLAQDFLLDSSNPNLALDLRCDIQDWNVALSLAEQMDKARVPLIKRNLAESLERQGKYQQALNLYEASKIAENAIGDELKRQKNHNISC
jgi:WD repeat-containing protein 19